jgi:uncharacterized delta-60 repeat protein
MIARGLGVALLVLAGCGSDAAICDDCVLLEGLPEAARVRSLAVDREGRLLAAIDDLVVPAVGSVARMDRAGVLDPAFGTGGVFTLPDLTPTIESSHAIVEMPDGAIRLGGRPEYSGGTAVFGFTADGREDGLRLASPGDLRDAGAAIALMDQGGSLVVAYGHSSEVDHWGKYLVRYTPAGEIDPAFPPIDAGSAVAMAPDGKIVMASGAYPDASHRFFAWRVTRDGQPDPSFGGGEPVIIPDISTKLERRLAVVASAAGGMILAGVGSGDGSPDPRLVVARFDAAGQLDPSFGGGRGLVLHDVIGSGSVHGVAEAADGGIVIVGQHNDLRGSFRAVAVRLTSDGSLDRTFGDKGVVFGASDTSDFHCVLALPDGEIVAGGHVSSDIVRLQPLFARFPAR